MVNNLEAEFSYMEETISGVVYIGGGKTEAMRQIGRINSDIKYKISLQIDSTVKTKT